MVRPNHDFHRRRGWAALVGGRNIYSPRLVPAEQLGGGAPARLLFEIDIGKLLTVSATDDKAGVVGFLDGPRRRQAAGGSYLTQIKVRTSRDFLLLNLSAALKCEATDEICPACAQRYRRNNLVQHSDESPKLSLVRNI